MRVFGEVKEKSLFIYPHYKIMLETKNDFVQNLENNGIDFKDYGSRMVLDDCVYDFSFVGDNIDKFRGNYYDHVSIEGDLSFEDKTKVRIMTFPKNGNIRYL